jgi:phosphoglycolate phosphatase-like HAD superfamily hydrolase
MKLFVWDFHGVLEKDNEKAVIDISNRVLSNAGFAERFTDADNERYYGLKWYQYFERLLPDSSPEQHLELQTACFQYDRDNPGIITKHIKPNDFAIEVLGRLAQSNNKQIVISNTRQKDLFWFLDIVGIRHFFEDDTVIGVNAHQTHASKRDALKDYLKDKNFEEIIAIGDSEGDLALGKSFNATTYFYKHPHRKHGITENADYAINDLRDILKEITDLK